MKSRASGCSRAQRNASDWIDRQADDELRSHIESCASCSAEIEELGQLRATLRDLPRMAPPADLAVKLRVSASQASQRRRQRSTWRARWNELKDRAGLFVHNLMRPIALPMAGGLASTVFLFGMALPTLTIQHVTGTDVPINEALYTQAALYVVSPVGYCDDNVTVDVLIDEQGKMIEYSFPEGKSVHDPTLLRGLENALLFNSYKPATSFGQPTSGGRVRLTFRRSEIDVKG